MDRVWKWSACISFSNINSSINIVILRLGAQAPPFILKTMSDMNEIKKIADRLLSATCRDGQKYKNIRINSNIDFYIDGKRVKGKTRSCIHEGKYIDVFANGKTYLCRFDPQKNKFIAIK